MDEVMVKETQYRIIEGGDTDLQQLMVSMMDDEDPDDPLLNVSIYDPKTRVVLCAGVSLSNLKAVLKKFRKRGPR